MRVQALEWAIQSCLCAAVILAAAFAATLTMRRAAAATRHWIWSCAVVGALLSPLAIVSLPKWEVGPVAGLERLMSIATPTSGVAPNGAIDAAGERARSNSAVASPSATHEFDHSGLLAFVWASGTTAMLLYAFLGIIAQWRIRRLTQPPPATWVDQLRLLAEIQQMRRPIGIAKSDRTATPIVCGFWNPLIILPRAASEWSPERLRVVLTHELAHIKRGDCFTQTLAQFVCAAYWFNPLAWIAAHGLRVEQERACDDFVLTSGTKASAYASHLGGIARSAHPIRLSPLTAVTLAMARCSQMEVRLMAILDPTIHRSPGPGSRACGAAMILLVTTALSTLQLRPPGATVAVDADGENALVIAAHQGQEETVKLLLDHGVDVNAAPGDWNALIAAAHQGQVETVKLLLDRGADVNAAVGGWTALVAAAHQGQEETVGLLLDRGADMNAAPGGQNALATAVRRGERDVTNLLVEREADPNSHVSLRAREEE